MEKNKEIQQLEQEIERLNAHVKHLQQTIGKWKSVARGTSRPKTDYIRSGFDSNGWYYRVYMVKSIPKDLPIGEVLQEIKDDVLPKYHPFIFDHLAYSGRADAWILQVKIQYNFNLGEEETMREWQKIGYEKIKEIIDENTPKNEDISLQEWLDDLNIINS